MALDSPYLSEIALFAFGFAPQGWATCSGQLLPINQNQALFSLLGTTYGGNGQTTFALPDLRGRVPMGFGPDPAPGHDRGETGGSETATLAVAHLPQHVHVIDASGLTATAACTNGAANQRSPVGAIPAMEAAGVTAAYSNAPPDGTMKAGGVPIAMTTGVTGGGQPHANRQPYLALNYCIALQGVFPSPN
jgi:microcystin-dependent protein